MKKITLLFCLFFSLVGLAQTANLVISKTSPAPIYYPGVDNTITYFVQIGNNAATNAEDVLVEIPFHASVDLTSVAWIAPDGTTGTGVISQTIDINAGQIAVYQITVTLPIGYIQGTSLIASVDTTHATLSANLLHHITNYTFVAGTDMVYTITVANQGPDDAINVVVQDIIPSIAGMDLTSVSWTGSNGTTGTGNLQDTIAVLPIGDVVTYTLTLPIPDGYSQTINNTVNVTADNAVADVTCFTCSHYASPQELLGSLVVSKTSPMPNYYFNVDQSITYFVQIGNTATTDALDTSVTISYHPSVNAANVQWTAPNGSTGTGVISQTIDIDAGEVVVYKITVLIPPTYVQGTNLIASVVTTHPTLSANLLHHITNYTYVKGTNMVYTITVENQGSANAIDVVVQDIIPVITDMDLTSVVWTGSNGTAGTGNLEDTIATLAPGAIITYTITLPIPADYDLTINNNVNITADNALVDVLCFTCSHYASPQEPRAHLVTTKTNNSEEYIRGTYVDYVITVTNQGPNDAYDVHVNDAIPSGISQMTWTSNGASGIGSLDQTIPVLENGQTIVFNIQIFVPEDFDLNFNLINSVWVTTPTLDPNPQTQPITDIDLPASPYLQVYPTLYSVQELVEDVLIDMDCSLVENISAQGFRSTDNTMGYFKANNSGFPIREGIVIKTGPISTVAGPYSNGAGATNGSGISDAQLNAIGGGTLRDVSYIEFDFTPITDELKFNFLFASNEYGTYQCDYGDVFAFILTDLTTGVSTNLAVIPGTNPPVRVAVTTIKDGAYNSSCGSENIEFFDQMNTAGDAINMKGNTVKMTASGAVVPCRKYRIKLAIGDWGDTGWDSAVFLEAGSFDIGALDLGEDKLEVLGNAACFDEEVILSSGLPPVDATCDIDYEYQWYKDGVAINGATAEEYHVTETGVYTLETTITLTGSGTGITTECSLKPGTAIIQIFDEIPAGQPNNLTRCEDENDTTFDLTDPALLQQIYGDDLDSNDTEISFHLNMNDLVAGVPIEWNMDDNGDYFVPSAFVITGSSQNIFVKIHVANGSDCYAVRQFTLSIVNCDVTAPEDIALCDQDEDGSESVDLAALIADIAPGIDDATITFHSTQSGANDGTTDIIDHSTPYAVTTGTTVTVYIRVLDNDTGFDYTELFNISINQIPQILQTVSDYELCLVNPSGEADFDLTSKTTEILDGATATLTFYTSEALAQAGADGTELDTTTTYASTGNETIWVRATDANGCYSITSFELVINDDFQIEQDVTDYELCDENGSGEEEFDLTTKATEILGTQTATLTFYTSQANAQSGTDGIATPRTSTGETIWVRAETADGCFDITSFLLVVKPLGNVPSPAPIEVCANNNAASVTFDLTSVLGDVMGAPTDVVTFHQTLAAAQTATAAITPANAYVATANQTIYIRIVSQDPDICPAISSVNLVKLASPVLATTIANYELCDDGTGQAEFDLTSKETEILGTTVATLTYYTSQANAIGKIDEITTPATYMSASATIWVRAENANDCYTIKSFNLVTHVAPIVNAPTPLIECNNGGTGQADFDLTSKTTEILDADTATLTFYTSETDAIADIDGTLAITTPTTYTSTGNETIWVRATDANGCYSITSFELVINDDFQIEQDVTDYELCDENGSGEEEFDLTTKATEILGTQTATLTFYTSQANAQSGTDGIATPRTSTGETIWVRAETADGCFDITSFLLVVKPLGNVPSPAPIEVCANNNAASVTFDLTSVLGDVMGAPTDVVTFHQTLAAAQTATAAITPANAYVATANQTIYIRIVSQDPDICPAISSVNLVKLASPVLATTIANYELCDDGTGQAEFDLTSKETEILGATVATLTYYTSQANAIGKIDEITTPATYMSASATIWVRAENANDCYTIKSFNLVLHTIPVANTPEPLAKCNDGTGQAEFNLNSRNNAISGGAVGVIVTYHTSLVDAENGDNAQTSPYIGTHQEILYVRVVSPFGCVNTTQTLELILEESTIAPTLPDLTYCDPNSDGWGVFDLTQIEQIIIDANPNPVTITYHETIEDAEFLANIIDSPEDYFNIGYYTQTIYIAITPASGEACSSITQVNLIVHNLPQITAPTPIETCDDDYDGFANFDLTIRNTEILNGLNPADYTIGYYPTEQDAILNTNAIANPTNYTNLVANQDSVWVRVTDINTGCFATKELVLIVNPLPVVDMPNVAEYRLCDFGEDGYEIFDLDSRVEIILDGQTGLTVSFYQTYDNAFDGVQPITDLMYQNQEQYVETIFVRVETQKGCFVVTLMDLVVDPLPVLSTPTNPIVSCDGDGDGYGTVNLEEILEEMLNGANPTDFAISFHETYSDAELNANSIDNPQEYYNIDPFNQVIYIRVESTLGSGCYNIYPINIEIVSAPVLPVEMDGTLPDLVLCDDNQDELTHFDLTVQTAYILDQQTDITNLEVTYYISEQNAIDRALAIGNMTNYPNISNPQTIWVVLENTLTGCFDIAAFDLVVNLPLDVPMPIPSITLCDEDGDLEVTFDLTVRLNAILANASDPNNYTVEFFYTYTDAINGNTTNLIADPTNFSNLELGGGAVYTLGVRVTDNTTGCQSYAIMDIRRAPIPNIPIVPLDPLEVCDNTNDDLIEAFDLTVYESFIRNGDSNVIITYHATPEDAQEGTNAIVDPTAYESASTTIYIRVANKPNGGMSCAVILELELIVNPLPIVADNSFEICEANSSGYAEFFFPDFNPQLLGPTQDLADFTISYHLTQADAIGGTAHIPQGTPYTNQTQFAEVIWTRIVNNDTGCIRIAEITLYAEEGAVANQPAEPITECDYDGTNDGFTNTDLTQYETEILGMQNPTQFIVTYHLTEQDAHDAVDAITNPENFTNTVAGGQTIYIRVENSSSNAPCYDVTQMEYIVEELAEPIITSPLNTICVDWGSTLANDPLVLDSNITAAGYSFEWYRNGTLIAGADQSTYTITSKGQEGSYYVIATSAEGCVSEVSNTFEVFLSGQATLVDIITENAFSDNQTITVIVEGNGQYVYQLDHGPIQQTGYFPNVTAGEHTVTVYDTTNGNINTTNSCGTLVISDVQIIDYPRFFTPNGDGYNDLWNITGLTDFHKAEIYIFDRHGKLLKQLNPQGEGWNGNLNGNQLPATDYWFKVIYTENNNRKEFRAHFSLKR